MHARHTIALVLLTAACIDRGGGVPMAPDEPVAASGEAPALFTDSIVLGSGLSSATTDPSNQLVSCTGPACPGGPFPQAAFTVRKHQYYAEALPGTRYIAQVGNGTTLTPPGFTCCTTAVFENTFTLPAGSMAATVTIDVLADNQARVSINGILFGVQPPSEMSNFMGPAHSFTTTFTPDSSGTNRLTITFVDEGGALGLNYRAKVSYARAPTPADPAAIPR